MQGANKRFVADHVAHRWLDINELETWPGHNADIRAAASRRGLTVYRRNKTTLFFSGKQCVASQQGMVTSFTAASAVSIVNDKSLTKYVLERSGVPTPRAQSFISSDMASAVKMLEADSGPWVVKPSDARAGEGITTGVTDANQLDPAWSKATQALSRRNSQILVEREIDGVDLRVFVVAGRAISAAVRLPAFVIGDGSQGIHELLAQLYRARTMNAYVRPKPINVDPSMLKRQTFLSMEDVPSKNAVVFLNATANIHQGGVSVEVTETVAPQILRLAEDACTSVPGLGVAGVDLLVPDIRSAAGAQVIEMNSSANSAINQYPAFGQGRDVTSAIVDGMLQPIPAITEAIGVERP